MPMSIYTDALLVAALLQALDFKRRNKFYACAHGKIGRKISEVLSKTVNFRQNGKLNISLIHYPDSVYFDCSSRMIEIGHPQCGQAGARRLTVPPQSGHTNKLGFAFPFEIPTLLSFGVTA